MDNELFELCKEVYKLLPNWEPVGQWKKWDGDVHWSKDNEFSLFAYPLYTSDYLLEKLPKYLRTNHEDNRLELSPQGHSVRGLSLWCALYTDVGRDIPYLQAADTPLKALLKLTIALHEAGELK